MTQTPLRQLPVTSPPAPYETLESYLNRLERLNHLRREELTQIIAITRIPRWTMRRLTGEMIDIQRLSAMAGYSVATLHRAMPQLQQPDWRLFQHDPRPACRRCVQRAGGPVTRYYRSYSFVCLKHRAWIGGHPRGVHMRTRPLIVNRLPDVLAAQKRHHHLVRRHGQLAVTYALRHAQACIDYWTRHSLVQGVQAERLNILLSPGWERVRLDDPAYLASYYPELVALTATLTSPRWRTLAADPYTRPAFLAEVRRQTGELAYRGGGPLNDWIADLVQPRFSAGASSVEPNAPATDQRI
jgi:hypothetical protein